MTDHHKHCGASEFCLIEPYTGNEAKVPGQWFSSVRGEAKFNHVLSGLAVKVPWFNGRQDWLTEHPSEVRAPDDTRHHHALDSHVHVPPFLPITARSEATTSKASTPRTPHAPSSRQQKGRGWCDGSMQLSWRRTNTERQGRFRDTLDSGHGTEGGIATLHPVASTPRLPTGRLGARPTSPPKPAPPSPQCPRRARERNPPPPTVRKSCWTRTRAGCASRPSPSPRKGRVFSTVQDTYLRSVEQDAGVGGIALAPRVLRRYIQENTPTSPLMNLECDDKIQRLDWATILLCAERARVADTQSKRTFDMLSAVSRVDPLVNDEKVEPKSRTEVAQELLEIVKVSLASSRQPSASSPHNSEHGQNIHDISSISLVSVDNDDDAAILYNNIQRVKELASDSDSNVERRPSESHSGSSQSLDDESTPYQSRAFSQAQDAGNLHSKSKSLVKLGHYLSFGSFGGWKGSEMPGLDFGPQKTESCDFSPYQEPEPDTLDNNWDVPETGTGPTHDENRVVPAKQSKARFRGKKQYRLVKAATRKRTQMMFSAGR